MAFKFSSSKSAVPISPDLLFRELSRRTLPDVLPVQRDILQEYAKSGQKVADLAIQLPTGSGKTLAGLLIAEWNLRKNGERVVYLCPNIQLVHQVVDEANHKYGLSVVGFEGSKKNYSAADKTAYEQTDKVAVTNYSSLFNTAPYFHDPGLIILDDAHAVENYVAKMWSLSVERNEEKHSKLYTALVNLVQPHLKRSDVARLRGTQEDRNWVEKVSTPRLLEIKDQLIEILDAHNEEADLFHSWKVLRDHVEGCHLYLSGNEILLRPLIPPTWTHEPFAQARQRIYMSATLGRGGDLERLTGRFPIQRQPAPPGSDVQGVGRRFFVFPSMNLDEEQTEALAFRMIKKVDRALVLVPSDTRADKMSQAIREKTGYSIFGPKQIEKDKSAFVKAKKAVAVLANRYDGIDFPDDDCRLLFIEGFPKGTNLQERFMIARMAANSLYHERSLTRTVQAVGRCTRSLLDRSVVVLLGQELPDSLGHPKMRKHYHPSLQAELEFGLSESKSTDEAGFLDNLDIFLENGADWEAANLSIEANKAKFEQEQPKYLNDLTESVLHEIGYQRALWAGDPTQALAKAEAVLGTLVEPELKGYRAMWHYLAGCAALEGSRQHPSLDTKARQHFKEAQKGTLSISWLAELSLVPGEEKSTAKKSDEVLATQIERLEKTFTEMGTLQPRNLALREKAVLEAIGTSDAKVFERGMQQLGELLGFETGKIEIDASPDPWWRIGNHFVIVFEAHSGGKDGGVLSAMKARQAMSHPDWIKMHEEVTSETEVICVVVSPAQSAKAGAAHVLHHFSFWALTDFRTWAENALACLRKLHSNFAHAGDMIWKVEAIEGFQQNQCSGLVLLNLLKEKVASENLPIEKRVPLDSDSDL